MATTGTGSSGCHWVSGGRMQSVEYAPELGYETRLKMSGGVSGGLQTGAVNLSPRFNVCKKKAE